MILDSQKIDKDLTENQLKYRWLSAFALIKK